MATPSAPAWPLSMIYIALVLMFAGPFPPPAKNSINVEVGGVLSGPSRRYVDLESGVLLASATAARMGDGANVTTQSLPIGASLKLPARRLEKLRKLADQVVKAGAESRRVCQPTADRTIVLDIERPSGSVSGAVYCPSAQTEALLDVIFEADGHN